MGPGVCNSRHGLDRELSSSGISDKDNIVQILVHFLIRTKIGNGAGGVARNVEIQFAPASKTDE
jgi:hypothetical protein